MKPGDPVVPWICAHCGGANVAEADKGKTSDWAVVAVTVCLMALLAFIAWLVVTHT